MTDIKDINKKVLIDKLAERGKALDKNLTKKAAGQYVDLVFDIITETLAEGGKVDVTGFGKFEVKHREGRTGINPATREKIEIAASNVPTFKAAKALKDSVK